MSIKKIALGVGLVIGLIFLMIVNPFSTNDAGSRTVVQQTGGKQFVQFSPGVFYAGFFAKETEWPNQISVTYQAEAADDKLEDNSIEVGKIKVMFSDGTTAYVNGIAQYVLPAAEDDMILIHNTHRTPQSLVSKRLAPFTIECLQSSAQTMTSDKHYGGGRAQMSQDFLDQLRNGVFLSKVTERVIFDSVNNEKRRIYLAEVQTEKDGKPKRKPSSIKEYEITVADASIINTAYAPQVLAKLDKIIEAATKSAVSRQALMTAQQETLTAKARGEQALVEIEYQQKQEQTKQVVEAETKVKVAEQDKLQQRVQAEAAELESRKIKTLADAKAYQNTRLVAAGLTPQERAQFDKDTKIGVAEALSKLTLPTTYMAGNGGGKEASMLESILGVQLLNVEARPKN